MTTIDILQVDNGFIVNYLDYETESDEPVERALVFEYKDSTYGMIEAAEEMLWFIIEQLGLGGSRYDEKRLRVGFEKGDKYEEGE